MIKLYISHHASSLKNFPDKGPLVKTEYEIPDNWKIEIHSDSVQLLDQYQNTKEFYMFWEKIEFTKG